jgi:endonuclease YncB( thermonuclease family)
MTAWHTPALIAALLSLSLIRSCGGKDEPAPTYQAAQKPLPTLDATPTFPPTWTPRLPTPTNTRVVPIPSTYTPGPSPTPTRLPARIKALVIGVQDSRTIEVLVEGQRINQALSVRLLGVEPPLLSDPWSGVALEWLRKEVGRQVVTLEGDQIERDTQGNLLRYVWKEGHMLNVTMVQLGLGKAATQARDLYYGADLLDAQRDAQEAQRGLWGPPPTPALTLITATATLTTTQTPTSTVRVTQTAPLTPTLTPSP